MASDSATAIATQQSIKAYVDSQVGSFDTLAEVLAQGNTTGGTNIAVGTGDDITFADSSKAIFGAGPDLRIYHDGLNSYINDTSGTGNLYIASNQLIINNAANNENMARFTENGAATLYYAGAAKLATTATGIDITGTVTADGLTMASGSQGVIGVFGTSGLQLIGQTASDNIIGTMGVNEPLIFRTESTERMRISSSSGNVGIGTSSPALAGGGTGLHINATSYPELKFTNSTTGVGAGDGSLLQSSGNNFSIQNREAGSITFSTSNTLRATLDASGNLLVGRTTSGTLTVVGSEFQAGGAGFHIRDGGTALFVGRKTSDGNLVEFSKDGTTVGSIGVIHGNNLTVGGAVAGHIGLQFGTGIIYPTDNTGAANDAAVDIGASGQRFKDLYLSGVSYNGDGSAAAPSISFGADTNTGFYRVGSDQIGFATAGTIKAKLDASGDLLLGKTVANLATVGVELSGGGYIRATRDGNSLTLNRLNTDGNIATFTQDGTTVGSIGTNSGYMVIGSPVGTDAHLLIGNGIIHPATSTGAGKDNAIDIGGSGNRFKDLYLSGGVYLGGTGAANKLEDYEEGAWTPVISTSTPPTTPFGQYNDGASYTKIGNVVFLYAMFRTNGVTIAGAAGDVIITGLPFTPSSSVSGGGLTVLQTSNWVTGPRAGYARTTNDIALTYTPTATDEVSPLPYTALTTGAGLNNLIQITVVYRTDS
jgi:hypothetical protein